MEIGRLSVKCLIACLALAGSALAWDTAPHQKITQAALDSLPAKLRSRLGLEAVTLGQLYCMLPDRYLEMEKYRFVRKSDGPKSADEIRAYCVRPDGEAVHSASFRREEDLASVIFLFDGILRSLSEDRTADAAKYMGTLAHFVEDSLSPPHSAVEFIEMHGVIEQSVPTFSLAGRPARPLAAHVIEAAEALLDRCYAAAEQNRKDLTLMVTAAKAGDEQTLNRFRLRAGRAAAELLADVYCTLLEMASY